MPGLNTPSPVLEGSKPNLIETRIRDLHYQEMIRECRYAGGHKF